jgi:peptidoglycan/xylan/chitin deacetylase (PgdA/CDA1 family)
MLLILGLVGCSATGSTTSDPSAKQTPVVKPVVHLAPLIALTFDDGPTPTHTPYVLDVLKAKGVKATFFLLGDYAEKYPGLVRRIQAEGHVIGNHSFDHPEFPKVSPAEAAAQIIDTNQILRGLTGEQPVLFRYPYGEESAAGNAVIRSQWMTGGVLWHWSSNLPGDFDCPGAAGVQRYIETEAVDQAVILLHVATDVDQCAASQWSYLPRTIDSLRARGFRFGVVEMALHPSPVNQESWVEVVDPMRRADTDLLPRTASWLMSAAQPTTVGGIAWSSVIQRPHLQTDRDVGAAGIAYGLLSLADASNDPGQRERYLAAARKAGDFLLAAQSPPESGRWPDYVDPGQTSKISYTSFDDGTAGIADLLWLLWEHTKDRRYRDGAVAGMDSLVGRAEGVGGKNCPEMCRWRWSDFGPGSYRNGIGLGQAGIVYALSLFAQRTGDARYRTYAVGGSAYVESRLQPDGGMPESDTTPIRNTGYVHGAAGAAFMFLRMYQFTGDQRWLVDARRLLGFLDRTAVRGRQGLSWPVGVDAQRRNGDQHHATGMEEGAAGIGWAYLQAYEVTGVRHYLEMARQAGLWLTDQVQREHKGAAWAEYSGSPVVHSGVNSGVAGIGWYLYDLGLATRERSFTATAVSAREWLTATVVQSRDGTFWQECRSAGQWRMPGEPSWHWGSAGIAVFLARLGGWRGDSPGMQSGLVSNTP